MNALDRAINTDMLTVSKSFLPYLNMDYQKPLAILIKAIELMYTVNLYSKEDSLNCMTRSLDTGWEREFLNEVKSNLSKDKAYFIDVALKISEAKDILNMASNTRDTNTKTSSFTTAANDEYYNGNSNSSHYNQNNYKPNNKDESNNYDPNPIQNTQKSNSSGPDQIIDKLSPMLEPGQLQLLKMLSGMMK